ncbi:MAG TPA: glycosyltransferase family 2 protein [Bryobacteraceae bacterium]|jgi:glycosyltransferase involved in cell wall biosynthesis|nr:glycosyltransferase family 2 protein [Bryobacteraceae bacterium]
MASPISVIIPVYNAETYLRRCLTSLAQSSEPALECIVVDDGSTDGSVDVAREFGATVLSTEGRTGPAFARNLGANAARGEILFFVDSDVCVQTDTLAKVAGEFARDPEIDAVMGSYDDWPSAKNFMSQYRNLMHHYVHQNSRREAVTFWAGCGAMRRAVFLEFGGFDEAYRTPAIEDIELGYRLSAANRKLVLCSNIQVKHLKRWGVGSVLKTDFYYRALPWSELTFRSGSMPNDLNLQISQRISVMLGGLLGALGAYLAASRGVYFLVPFFATFFILLSAYWMDYSSGKRRLIIYLMVGVMALITLFAYLSHQKLIIPMVLMAAVALFARHRYTYPYGVWHRRTGIMIGAYCLLVIAFVWIYLPMHKLGTGFLVVLLTLVWLNKQFYLFLAGHRGKMFALAAIPFHILYFISSGLAFALAMVRYRLGLSKHRPSIGTPAANARAAGR